MEPFVAQVPDGSPETAPWWDSLVGAPKGRPRGGRGGFHGGDPRMMASRSVAARQLATPVEHVDVLEVDSGGRLFAGTALPCHAVDAAGSLGEVKSTRDADSVGGMSDAGSIGEPPSDTSAPQSDDREAPMDLPLSHGAESVGMVSDVGSLGEPPSDMSVLQSDDAGSLGQMSSSHGAESLGRVSDVGSLGEPPSARRE